MKSSVLIISLITLAFLSPSYAAGDNLLEFNSANIPVSDISPKQKEETGGIFSLTTIMDNFLNFENSQKEEKNLDESDRQRKAFVSATKKFNQGNITVAYDEYETLLDSINSDYALLVYAKSMYEIGFFSIGSKSLDKIKHKDYLKEQIADLKKSYLPAFVLDKNEEIYLAKAYSSIYFDNSAQESAYELNQKSSLMEKSDYANYVLSQAFNKTRQYQQALIYINKAQSMNPKNISYLNFKVKILIGLKKYKEALKIVENIENSPESDYIFKNSFLSQKQTILANLTKDEDERKFYLAYKTFIDGNYEKTVKDCKNILSFDKNNYKILTLLAMAQFITGDKENAKKNYSASYNINKNYAPTLSGLGDVAFCEYDLDGALKNYKKALSLNEKDQTTALKLALIYKNNSKYSKDLKNLEKRLKKMDSAPFMSYHQIALSAASGNPNLKREYISRATSINPLYENGWVDFLNFEIENNRLATAKSFLYMISFSNQSNYIYYYLNALYDIARGATNEAIVNLKNCLSLNPDFEAANKKLLEILPNKVEDFSPKIMPEESIDQPVL